MAVWGIGSMFCGTEEQKDNFIKENFICVGWKECDKPEIYKRLGSIKTGDLIYIKSLFHTSKTMKIKAIGIATSELKRENNCSGYEELGNKIDVKWLNSEVNKTIEINDDKLNERKTTLFCEENNQYIKSIIEFI